MLAFARSGWREWGQLAAIFKHQTDDGGWDTIAAGGVVCIYLI